MASHQKKSGHPPEEEWPATRRIVLKRSQAFRARFWPGTDRPKERAIERAILSLTAEWMVGEGLEIPGLLGQARPKTKAEVREAIQLPLLNSPKDGPPQVTFGLSAFRYLWHASFRRRVPYA